MRVPLLLLCIFVGMVTNCLTLCAHAEATQAMTVCQLYAVRQAPSSRDIRLTAAVYKDPRHDASFVDHHCPPGTAIGLRFADHLPPRSKAAQFDKALTGT